MVELVEEVVKVTAGELPLKGLSDGPIVVLEVEQAVFQLVQTGEVVWRQRLSL